MELRHKVVYCEHCGLPMADCNRIARVVNRFARVKNLPEQEAERLLRPRLERRFQTTGESRYETA